MEEEWIKYKETDSNRWGRNIWEVSNFGRLRKNGEVLELRIGNSGYYYRGGQLIHRIVAQVFIPNPNNYRDVDHIDGNRLNNRVDNLRWCTHAENINKPEWKAANSRAHKGQIPWNKGKHPGNGWTLEHRQTQSEKMKGNQFYKYTRYFKNKEAI